MRVTHVHVFIIGWAYYLGGPVIAAYLGLLNSVEAAEPWLKYINIGGVRQWALPLYSVLMPAAFLIGDRISNKFKRAKPRANRVRSANGILLPIYALLLFIFAVAARDKLFTGYVEGYDPSLIGPIATLQMMILFQYLLYRSSGDKVAARLNLMLLATSSVILLSMGGRLYVITSFVAIYFYYWNWGSKSASARRHSLLWAFFLLIALGLVGMWRMGITNYLGLGIYLFAEPLFTSISAFSIMQSDAFYLFNQPKDFFFAFLNIVPSGLWPEKSDFFASLATDSYNIESPFGSLSIVASSVSNFGFIGGLIFVAFVGFIMGRSRINAITPITRAFYCYLVGLVMFVFFRDPFQVQVKLVLTGLLLSLLYYLISKLSTPNRAPHLSKSSQLNQSKPTS